MSEPGGGHEKRYNCEKHDWEPTNVRPGDLHPPAHRNDVIWSCRTCGGQTGVPMGQTPRPDHDADYSKTGIEIDDDGYEIHSEGDEED